MRLYEHEAKKALQTAGIAVPRCYYVGSSPTEIRRLRPEFPVVVKAQVLSGGRGKAGGILRATNAAEMIRATRRLLGSEILGYTIETVLIEQAVEFSAACYLGAALNPATTRTVLMGSAKGGVDIETLASKQPGAIIRAELDPLSAPAADGFRTSRRTRKNQSLDPSRAVSQFMSKQLCSETLEGQIEALAASLLELYRDRDCTLLEINPLFVTPVGLVAADAKMVLDTNSLYRQRDFLASIGIHGRRHVTAESTIRELRAEAAGFAYVDLLPDNALRERGKVYVGLAPGGAGYGIFSIDEVINIGSRIRKNTFVPLNFMDSGGGPSRQAVKEMFSLLLDHPLVDLIVTSRFGGISSCDIFIQGLVECLRERTEKRERIKPIYGRMVGTDLAAARQFLRAAQRDTPHALTQLHMEAGNERIMADVIRDALTDFLKRKTGA